MSIDNRVTVEFELRSPAFLNDPAAGFAALRETGPVAWSRPDQQWMITGYDAVHATLQNHRCFSNEAYGNGSSSPKLLVLGQDPPIHSAYRRPLNPWMSPGVVERLGPKIEAYSVELFDRVVSRGRCDIVIDYGNPYPALVVLELCGLDTDRWREFAEPNHALQYAKPGSPDMERAVAGMYWIAGEIGRVAALRRDDPRDDLVSELVATEVNGAPIPIEDVVGIVLTVVGGGVDTTTSLFANAVRYLDQDRDARQRLLDRPGLIPSACEEFLRYYTPAQVLSRSVTAEVEVAGQHLCPGERVGVAVAAANRDSAQFPDPDAVVLDRSPNRHAAFGLGIHRCVGSNLARAMIQTMLAHLLDRLPDYTLDGGERHYGGPIVNGWVNMPIRYTPGLPRGSGVQLPT